MEKTSSSKELDLSHKILKQIPPEVFSINEIEILDVSDNPLGSIPVNIANLSKLREMRAAGCGIREVSGNIWRCTHLAKVDLSRNPCITTLPVTMKQLHSLKHVVLSSCELKSLPKNLTLLAVIETLDLSNNELSTLPPDISGMKRLKVLILSDNAFEGIPESVEYLSHLNRLEVKRNKMNNSRGDRKINAPATLKTLDMEGNYSLKSLPSGLEKLKNLEELDISYCGIETLTDTIGKMTSIRRIHLAGNKLRTLPANFGNLLRLETLDLEGNRRLSSLPLSLYHLRKNLQNKQTGTSIGLILDDCPALALPESEVAQGNMVSVLEELLSEDIIEKASVIVAAAVVEDTIIEGLTENMVAVTEGRVWDDLMTDVTSVAIADKECSEDIFSTMLKEVMPGLVQEAVVETVNEERAMIIMTDELLEEMTRLMTEEVATNAMQADSVAWEVMHELVEEISNSIADEQARNRVQVDEMTWKVMEEMLEEAKTTLTNDVATDAVQIDAAAWKVMEEIVEEATAMLIESVATNAVQVDATVRALMDEMLEEANTTLANEVATDVVQIDDVAWKIMADMVEEATNCEIF
ncbi:leucine-rich repeat-containing protein 40-like [Branchiostoma lanceolatum]|uniref:leucine-rich repeat-containing protein 40-like n=1 Tax=Branchiostoma lanceolatum TaxID=7740 RepID=UPI0034546E22